MDRWVTYRQRLSAVNPPHQLNTVLVGVFNHTAWNEAVSLLHETWKDVVSDVMLSDSDESEEEGGVLSLSSFKGFLIWGRSAGWPQSSLLMWMGVGASGWGGGGWWCHPWLSQVLAFVLCKFRDAHNREAICLIRPSFQPLRYIWDLHWQASSDVGRKNSHSASNMLFFGFARVRLMQISSSGGVRVGWGRPVSLVYYKRKKLKQINRTRLRRIETLVWSKFRIFYSYFNNLKVGSAEFVCWWLQTHSLKHRNKKYSRHKFVKRMECIDANVHVWSVSSVRTPEKIIVAPHLCCLWLTESNGNKPSKYALQY